MSATTMETGVVKDAVWLACHAPSLHNSQPWEWVYDGVRLQLFLDPSRVMATDRSEHGALISCGAVLDHLRVAMAAAGWQANVDRFPDPGNANHLASIAFTPMDTVTEGDRRRAEAVSVRRTDRLPFNAPPDWGSFEPVLCNAVNDSVVHLDVMSDDVRQRLAEASELSDSLRLYDTLYHSELDSWSTSFRAWDGIPQSSLVTAAEGDRVDVGRLFPLARHGERRTQISEDNSKILVLSTDGDDRADGLASGEALSAVLLECTMAGLATCPVTHITEVRASREIIRALLDHDAVPQMLVRVGVAPAMEEMPPATPRRPLDDVLRVQG